MKTIKDLTIEDIIELGNFATNGYLKSSFCKEILEVEVGGYGKRRRIEYIFNDSSYGYTKQYFEIDSDNRCWHFYCGEHGVHGVTILSNIDKIIHYCITNNINYTNE